MPSNKEIVLQYIKAFNERDEATLSQIFTPGAVIYGVLGWGPIGKVIPRWREITGAFDLNLQVDSIVEQGDTVAVRYTDRGTSIGDFRGPAATGKSFETVAMEWFELTDGKINRRWGARDSAAQSRQMGLTVN